MAKQIDLKDIARKAAKAYAEQTWIKTKYKEDCTIRSIEALANDQSGICTFIAITKSGRALTVHITPRSKSLSVHITDTSWASGDFVYNERGELQITKPFNPEFDN